MKTISNSIWVFLLFLLLSCGCAKKSLSEHEILVKKAQKRLEGSTIQGQEILKQNPLFETKANELKKQSEAIPKQILIKSKGSALLNPCENCSGKRGRFPVKHLTQVDINKIKGIEKDPFLIYAEQVEVFKDRKIELRAKLVNPTPKTYNFSVKLIPLDSSLQPMKIHLHQNLNDSKATSNLPKEKEIAGVAEILHLQPKTEVQFSATLHPGSFLYYDFEPVLKAFQEKRFDIQVTNLNETTNCTAHLHTGNQIHSHPSNALDLFRAKK